MAEQHENEITEVRQSAVFPPGQGPSEVQTGLIPGESEELHAKRATRKTAPKVSGPKPTPQPPA